MAAVSDSSPKLQDIFNEIWQLYSKVDDCDEPSNSKAVQEKVGKGVEKCTRGVKMVNEIGLFSDNEEIDEISSNEIRYFLLPGFLAYFTNKTIGEDRLEIVTKSRVYWIDFLKLCKLYRVTDIDVPQIDKDETENETDDEKLKKSSNSRQSQLAEVQVSADQRQAKIERFKRRKETEKRLSELYVKVQKDHVDEEVKRDYYLTLLNKWIDSAVEELDSIEQEIPILEHMAKMKANGGDLNPPQIEKSKKPFRPFILTKTDLQKRVFGAGYPSLPTYSVEEFYDQQVAAGLMPGPEDVKAFTRQANGGGGDSESVEKDEIEKEQKIENDDEETLMKARQWDDWKDDHRRGWGNRKNMG